MTANNEHRFGADWLEAIGHDDFSVPEEIFKSLGDPSLLEPPETTLPNASDDTYRGRFMRGKEKEYAATEAAYVEIYKSPSATHLLNIRECRKFAKFAWDKNTGDVKIFSSACRDRWCPMCAAAKAAYAKEQTKIYIESLKIPRFLTLTLRNDPSTLKDQIEFLQDAFRRLRLRAFWRKNVTGGIWFLQVKRGKDSGCWHPHLHILLDGNYMEQSEISRLWELVTYGSPVIDIRKIHNAEAAAMYVSRYVARPALLSDMNMEDRIEVILALHGKRLCGTFGNGKAVTLTPPKIEQDGEWIDIGYHDEVVRDAKKNPLAKLILDAYSAYQPIAEEIIEKYTGRKIGRQVTIEELTKPQQILLDFYNTT